MRKTYVTRMPDKAGAFLLASRIIAACGGNIARVNYNRAVDTHTLFIEVSATAAQHAEIARQLSACGYLTELEDGKRILMIVLTLPDHPGAVTPVLEVLSRHRVNISYISSQENGTGVQHFKMGLLIENTGEIKRLIDEISRICEISILNYEVTDRLLDGTVFYITFANEMREILSLSQAQTNAVLIQANRLMQLLDEQDKPALKTFDYIRRFAQFVVEHRGAAFNAQVSTAAAGRRPHAHRPSSRPAAATPMCWNTTASFCAWIAALPVIKRRCCACWKGCSRAFPCAARRSGSRTRTWTTPGCFRCSTAPA